MIKERSLGSYRIDRSRYDLKTSRRVNRGWRLGPQCDSAACSRTLGLCCRHLRTERILLRGGSWEKEYEAPFLPLSCVPAPDEDVVTESLIPPAWHYTFLSPSIFLQNYDFILYFRDGWCSFICTPIFIIHSSADGQGWLQCFPVVNKVAINRGASL